MNEHLRFRLEELFFNDENPRISIRPPGNVQILGSKIIAFEVEKG